MPAIEVVKGSEARITKKVILLVDGSSSMVRSYPTAVALAVGIASQSNDEYEVLAMVFGTQVMKFTWLKMPSADDSKKILGWLTNTRPLVGGTTNAVAALKAAYEEAKGKNATIVFITDGDVPQAKLPEPDKNTLVYTVQTEHVDYLPYVTWAKKLNGMFIRLKCDHEFLDESTDPWQEVWVNQCHKCGKTKEDGQ